MFIPTFSKSSAFAAAAATFILASAALAQSSPAKVADSAKGKTFVDAKGMTLYTFAKDSPGKSTCNGTCAENWPPFAAPADAKPSGEWSVVTREDGSKMWAYKTKPLYTFKKDKAAGEAHGEGLLNGAWQIAAP
jgi:predicted lipoprotein with Yx(FWY)xxD motif